MANGKEKPILAIDKVKNSTMATKNSRLKEEEAPLNAGIRPAPESSELRMLKHKREVLVRNMETLHRVSMEVLESLDVEIDELKGQFARP